jgi:MFS family permease
VRRRAGDGNAETECPPAGERRDGHSERRPGHAVEARVRVRELYAEYHILVWMCVLIFVNQLGFGSIVPVTPLYAASFGVSPAAIGLTIAVYGLARFLLALPTGRLADRFGRRSTLAFGGSVTVVGNVLCAVAPTYPLFLGARFVAGAGAALTLTAAQIVMADISPPAQRGRMMGIYSGVFAFAVGIGPLPGGFLAERYGLAAPFLAYAILGGAVALIAWLRVPETRGMLLEHTVRLVAMPSFGQQMRLLASNTGFLLVSLIGLSAAVARTGAVFNVVPIMVSERLDLTPAQIGLGLSLLSLGALVLAYPSGVLVDYFGRKAVIVPATLISGLAAALFVVTPSFSWYLFACGVWAFSLGIASDAPGAYAADTAPPGMNAAVMSTYRMLSDAGYVLGPLALGIISGAFGASSALVVAAALLVVSALLFARFAPEKYVPMRRRAQVNVSAEPGQL